MESLGVASNRCGALNDRGCTVPALQRVLAGLLLALPTLATSALGQQVVVGWGNKVFNSSWDLATDPGVGAGWDQSFALRGDGSLDVWGENNQGLCSVPALPPGVAYVQVSGASYYMAALRSEGSIAVWPPGTLANVPPLPPGLTYVEVDAGGTAFGHLVARRSDGTVVAWGDNSEGQCNVPALPTGVTYVEVSAGDYFSAARRSDGSVIAWGYNLAGQCNVPPLPAGLTYVELSSGSAFSVARRSDGSAVGWGANSAGQCNVPALPAGVSYTAIQAGHRHCLGKRSDGALVSWGWNVTGQCNVPVLPPGLDYLEFGAATSTRLRGAAMAGSWRGARTSPARAMCRSRPLASASSTSPLVPTTPSRSATMERWSPGA
jgi:hypothetical protein